MKSMLLLKKVLTPPLVVVFVPFTDFFIINYLLGFSYKKSKSHYYYYLLSPNNSLCKNRKDQHFVQN